MKDDFVQTTPQPNKRKSQEGTKLGLIQREKRDRVENCDQKEDTHLTSIQDQKDPVRNKYIRTTGMLFNYDRGRLRVVTG